MDLELKPQIDVAVGGTSSESGTGWQGLSIKDILERVDLFNVTMLTDDDDEKPKENGGNLPSVKDGKTVIQASNPEAAFLGPKIWKKPITFPMLNGEDSDSDGLECSLMNMDEFLSENNIDLDRITPPLLEEHLSPSTTESSVGRSSTDDTGMDIDADASSSPALKRDACSGLEEDNGFLYAESKRTRLEREKYEQMKKRKIMEVSVNFAPEELALATIPGTYFDPGSKIFSAEELRPQPIIRKRKKTYVPPANKDDKYWEKREKNNVAARRSREARRLKENQIALRTAFLEKENSTLKEEIERVVGQNAKLVAEKEVLLGKLKRYEATML